MLFRPCPVFRCIKLFKQTNQFGKSCCSQRCPKTGKFIIGKKAGAHAVNLVVFMYIQARILAMTAWPSFLFHPRKRVYCLNEALGVIRILSTSVSVNSHSQTQIKHFILKYYLLFVNELGTVLAPPIVGFKN